MADCDAASDASFPSIPLREHLVVHYKIIRYKTGVKKHEPSFCRPTGDEVLKHDVRALSEVKAVMHELQPRPCSDVARSGQSLPAGWGCSVQAATGTQRWLW